DVFLDDKNNFDVMANAVKEYYGNIYGSRGVLLEGFGRKEEAKRVYEKARLIFKNNDKKLAHIEERLSNLK
ncbi:MAG: hypothetical protein WCH76_06685, partial [Candidatus Riflemargulisbacteria bacterium]